MRLARGRVGRRDDAPAGLRRRPADDRRRAAEDRRPARQCRRWRAVGSGWCSTARSVSVRRRGSTTRSAATRAGPRPAAAAAHLHDRQRARRPGAAPARGLRVGRAAPAGCASTIWASARRGVPDGRLHPWFLAGRMAPLTRHNFTYGPTIHVRTQIQHRGLARADQEVVVGARIVEVYDRKDHWYQVLDGLVVGRRWRRRVQRAGAHPPPLDLPPAGHGHAGADRRSGSLSVAMATRAVQRSPRHPNFRRRLPRVRSAASRVWPHRWWRCC